MEDPVLPLDEWSDQSLVSRVCQDDAAAFSVLYDRYVRSIYALAAHMLDAEEAEDVVQEVFLRLWKKAHQYQETRGAFSTWLFAIARYNVLDRLRKYHQRLRLDKAWDIETLFSQAGAARSEVEEQIWQNHIGENVLYALSGLPAEQRRVLVLAYFSGLSHATIANHLGLPLGTVKKRIRLGLTKLRKTLTRGGILQDQEEDPISLQNEP